MVKIDKFHEKWTPKTKKVTKLRHFSAFFVKFYSKFYKFSQK